MNLKPLFDRVVLKNLKQKKETLSGIIIPDSVGDEPIYAEVIAVGDGESVEGEKTEISVKIGDKVLYNKYGAVPFKISGEEFVILRQSDILGIFMEENNG